jgi:peptidyl-prolyl cis-trans isomerase NIMA-interacting 1
MRQTRSSPAFALIAAASLFGGCSSLTSPPEEEIEPKRYEPPATVTAAARVQPQPTPVPPPAPKQEERVSASHVLVAYKGARGAAPTVVRTKDQAKKRAQEVQKKAKGAQATDFAALAKKYSDDPGSGPKGGDLGPFNRAQMVKPFSDAAFALKPGDVSEIVESDFGFHVIKRTQ